MAVTAKEAHAADVEYVEANNRCQYGTTGWACWYIEHVLDAALERVGENATEADFDAAVAAMEAKNER